MSKAIEQSKSVLSRCMQELRAQLASGQAKFTEAAITGEAVRVHASEPVNEQIQQEMDDLRDSMDRVKAGVESTVSRLEAVTLALEEFEADKNSLQAFLQQAERRLEMLQAPLDGDRTIDSWEKDIVVLINIIIVIEILFV